RVFQAAYRFGGWLLFTAPGLALVTIVSAGGLIAFLRLFLTRHGTPFVGAAGPVTDLVMAGGAALIATAVFGTWSDIAFQVSLGAYLGALFNLNPLLDRDGYHILVDLLRQPGLRARSRRRLQLRLAGRPVPDDLPSQ